MRALVVHEPGRYGVVDIPSPHPEPGEVLVRPVMVGVCGTDIELIDGTIDPAYVRYPLVLGHEWVGVLGEDVDGVASAGDRVVVEGVIPCGKCEPCRHGDTNRCVTYDEIGFTRPGAAGASIAVPSRLVHRIDASVDVLDAVLVEPMAVVWRALTRIAIRPGCSVAVVGDGTIALLSAHLVRLFDPAKVVVVGRRAAQSDLATRAGADAFVVTDPDERFDLVIEAAGTAESVASSVALCARGAMLILLGLPAHGTLVEIAPDDLVNDDIIVQGSFSYTSASFREIVQRINDGAVRPSFLVTHRFTLEQSELAVATLRGGLAIDEPRGKIVLELA